MSIDKQALREAAERAASDSWGYDRDEFNDAITPEVVLALLDELKSSENNLIDSECHVAELEEALRDKQALLEALDNALCELLPGTQYMDPPDGGSATPLEQVRRMVADYRNRIAELEAREDKPVMFIDGDISPADADKLASVIREFNEETETPAARMARIIRENPHPTNMCDMPAAGIGVKGE
ncbi:TPA: ead/Ea22-like family protein [Citrobacter murliniae]